MRRRPPKPKKVTEFEKVLAFERRYRASIPRIEEEARHVFELLVVAQRAASLLFEDRATPETVIAIYDRILDDQRRLLDAARESVERSLAAAAVAGRAAAPAHESRPASRS